MPFVLKDFHAPKQIKIFLFLMHEMGMTQAESQRYIAKGRVFISGSMTKDPSADVQGDFQCVVFVPATRNLPPIFKTDSFALFDKPSGILVHPQNRNTPYSMVDEIRYQFGQHANIAHRIDQETSGLLLAARNKDAEIILKTAFEDRNIYKTYLAFVHGNLSESQSINAPLMRRSDDSSLIRMIVKVHADGKPSRTDIRAIRYLPDRDMTLVEAVPFTGRQHQIRVHLFHVKHPIVGDPIYGQSEEDAIRFLDKRIALQERIEKSGASRLLLHAERLAFTFEGINYKLTSEANFEQEAIDAMGDVSRETYI